MRIFVALGLHLAAVALVGCGPSDAPVVAMDAGKIFEIRNCPAASSKYEVECLRLACEKVLFERGTIPAHAQIVAARSSYNVSDKPGFSSHEVKFPEQDRFRYAMCEMKGNQVTAVRELSAREQDW